MTEVQTPNTILGLFSWDYWPGILYMYTVDYINSTISARFDLWALIWRTWYFWNVRELGFGNTPINDPEDPNFNYVNPGYNVDIVIDWLRKVLKIVFDWLNIAGNQQWIDPYGQVIGYAKLFSEFTLMDLRALMQLFGLFLGVFNSLAMDYVGLETYLNLLAAASNIVRVAVTYFIQQPTPEMIEYSNWASIGTAVAELAFEDLPTAYETRSHADVIAVGNHAIYLIAQYSEYLKAFPGDLFVKFWGGYSRFKSKFYIGFWNAALWDNKIGDFVWGLQYSEIALGFSSVAATYVLIQEDVAAWSAERTLSMTIFLYNLLEIMRLRYPDNIVGAVLEVTAPYFSWFAASEIFLWTFAMWWNGPNSPHRLGGDNEDGSKKWFIAAEQFGLTRMTDWDSFYYVMRNFAFYAQLVHSGALDLEDVEWVPFFLGAIYFGSNWWENSEWYTEPVDDEVMRPMFWTYWVAVGASALSWQYELVGALMTSEEQMAF
mgnify:CR=1 FL=1